MKTLLKFIVLTPLALVLLIFALANRHAVTLSFDPFASIEESRLAITAPLFLILFLAAMIGVLAGGAATWLKQSKHRKAARQGRAEAARLRGQAETLRAMRGDERAGPAANLQHHA